MLLIEHRENYITVAKKVNYPIKKQGDVIMKNVVGPQITHNVCGEGVNISILKQGMHEYVNLFFFQRHCS